MIYVTQENMTQFDQEGLIEKIHACFQTYLEKNGVVPSRIFMSQDELTKIFGSERKITMFGVKVEAEEKTTDSKRFAEVRSA